MKHASILVRAEWDEAAKVWVATTADLDGLAIEAATMELLMEKIPGALCDLMELNGSDSISEMAEIPYHVMAQRVGRIPNPCH